MKSILAFGDSLTWGFVAGTWERHPFDVRWPNALAAGLGGKARVIEEGMNGRTTVFPDPTVGEERNGAVALPMLLTTHQPLDLVIIMLGTNDIKYANRCRAFDASMGMARLIEIVQRFSWIKTASPPQVLVMAPPALCKTSDEWFNDLWGHAVEESKLFARHYARVAKDMGVQFFDAGSVAVTDPTDGGHLDAANTRAIGAALVPVVNRILGI
jgi:lysophospholipase L1-like esterase